MIGNFAREGMFYSQAPIEALDHDFPRGLHSHRYFESVMSNYRRLFIPGGTWFFTVNLLQRQNNNLLIREIDLLRSIVESVRKRHPFRINAWVVLPEHMHAVWTLPPNDTDFSTR